MVCIDKLYTGVKLVDDQHKEIIRSVNHLLDTCEKHGNNRWEEAIETLNYLVEYIDIHFTDEEALQLECRYPGYEKHRKHHIYFSNYITKLNADFSENGLSEEMLRQLSITVVDWLINHIGSTDVEFAQYYLKHQNKV